ncbi:Uma2 family endonuclease [Nocardiopsis chromatogenes]|uniref:Uma2 family endonuclease n=1 Tax=Nocardiopsis chromatogenes TaxID=280239 RepID=UPI0003487C8E|nr:Uma2 family endonuclease [Nocardiopsis chromatogenes]
MCAQPVPDWMIPPTDGFTAEDLDRLPDLPPHTELIDGSLVLVSPQKRFHTLILDVLVPGLRSHCPAYLRVRREMTTVLGPRQRPEPDIMVVRASADTEQDQTSYPADSVELVVEVVSPESRVRDRERKPQLYAHAGIRHFWRVETDGGRPIVYVYELDPAVSSYVPTGIHHDRLKVATPFPIDIDLTEVDRL